ncbi:hypothetical protein OQG81_06755 [Streptococcus macedonicus]|uniref:Uncharacterized protein n=1 Tax=Streptococcus macedonicus TaxID=59310 RepID=A0AA47ILS5_STRMC|nr:hypothetical protein [Streptococcus macedonicus]WAK62440.1 hypothetical protein OQG81_06755 [Streptococcus macedonicus]
MSEKATKIPQIRFDGYTDAWEQRKLGEMGSTYTGLSGKTKEDFGHGNAKFIRAPLKTSQKTYKMR